MGPASIFAYSCGAYNDTLIGILLIISYCPRRPAAAAAAADVSEAVRYNMAVRELASPVSRRVRRAEETRLAAAATVWTRRWFTRTCM